MAIIIPTNPEILKSKQAVSVASITILLELKIQLLLFKKMDIRANFRTLPSSERYDQTTITQILIGMSWTVAVDGLIERLDK